MPGVGDARLAMGGGCTAGDGWGMHGFAVMGAMMREVMRRWDGDFSSLPRSPLSLSAPPPLPPSLFPLPPPHPSLLILILMLHPARSTQWTTMPRLPAPGPTSPTAPPQPPDPLLPPPPPRLRPAQGRAFRGSGLAARSLPWGVGGVEDGWVGGAGGGWCGLGRARCPPPAGPQEHPAPPVTSLVTSLVTCCTSWSEGP
jgi:hypothetical protein